MVRPQRVPVRALAIALGVATVLLVHAPAPAAAGWSDVAFPTQSLGDRGTDVSAVQLLLRARGLVLPADGVFGPSTVTAVKFFEVANGQVGDGIVDRWAWGRLVPARLAVGSRGDAVRALQVELRRKLRRPLAIDGVFGVATRDAVLAFERHIGQTPDGVMTPGTWRYLTWHFELPTFSSTTLCDYSVGNGPANWGTAQAVASITAAAAKVVTLGYGRVSVGDIGFEHGGDIPLHETHERGLDVDVRPLRRANDQCRWGTNWRWSSYDRAATRAFIRQIRAAAPGHIKVIYFNDPVLIREGLTRWYPGHDDHIHVRYCEKTHPVAMYDC